MNDNYYDFSDTSVLGLDVYGHIAKYIEIEIIDFISEQPQEILPLHQDLHMFSPFIMCS